MNYNFLVIDLWPYLLVALIFSLCFITKTRHSSKIIFFTLLIFCALRYDVGWDFMSYIDEIQSIYPDPDQSRFEFLSKYIIYLGGYFGFYPVVFILFAFFTLAITYKAIENYSINRLMSWLIFYSMPLFFLASLSTIRQSLAAAIVLYSYRFAKDKKYVYFFAAVYVAALVHISAIAGILILPFAIFSVGRITNAIVFICSFIFADLFRDFLVGAVPGVDLLSKLEFYINADSYKSSLIQYVYYLFGIFNIVFYNKLVRINPLNREYIAIANFGLIALNFLSFEPVSALRISALYFVFLIYIIPCYRFVFNKKFVSLVDVTLFICFNALTFVYLFIYINAYQNGLIDKISFIPYRFWFNNL